MNQKSPNWPTIGAKWPKSNEIRVEKMKIDLK